MRGRIVPLVPYAVHRVDSREAILSLRAIDAVEAEEAAAELLDVDARILFAVPIGTRKRRPHATNAADLDDQH
ncbi:MAG: hypothetical protein ACHREM_09385 [Polyangiales bacterium]